MTVTTIRLRNPWPPHQAIAEIVPEEGSLRYGFQLSGRDQMTFNIPRSDPNLTALQDNYGQIVGLMVTAERDDGFLPFVGYCTQLSARATDTSYRVTAIDAVTRLLAAARTQESGTLTGSAGSVLVLALAEMDGRAEPPLLFLTSRINTGGPATAWTFKADQGDSFVTRLAQDANFEWWSEYSVSSGALSMYLAFDARRGSDYSDRVILDESAIVDLEYAQDADGYVGSVVAVGGDGPFDSRPGASVNLQGRSYGAIQGAATSSSVSTFSPILRGAKVIINRNQTSIDALFARAQREFDVPEDVGESLSFTLFEDAVDMRYIDVGNVVTVQSASLNLGSSFTRRARITAIQMNPDTRAHSITAQIR